MTQPLPQGVRVGGSALPDGVMMLTPRACAIAREGPDGSFIVESFALPERKPLPIEKLPFLRILPKLFGQMGLVVRGWKPKSNQSVPWALLGAALVIGLASTALNAVFSFLPTAWHAAGSSVLQLAFFFVLIGLTRFVPRFGRIWRFHGGEHQAIAAYEAGEELTVTNTTRQSLYHPRCGTNLATLSLVFMVPGMVIGSALSGVVGYALTVVAPLPALCVAFEIVMLGQKHFKAVLWPGMMFQHLTVATPGEQESRAGIVALEAALSMHARVLAREAAPTPDSSAPRGVVAAG